MSHILALPVKSVQVSRVSSVFVPFFARFVFSDEEHKPYFVGLNPSINIYLSCELSVTVHMLLFLICFNNLP